MRENRAGGKGAGMQSAPAFPPTRSGLAAPAPSGRVCGAEKGRGTMDERNSDAASLDEVRQRYHNLHELVASARTKLNRNSWDYLIGGVETETTVRRNRHAL